MSLHHLPSRPTHGMARSRLVPDKPVYAVILSNQRILGRLRLLSSSSSSSNNNKSAQSNLGRGPRRGAVAHVRRKVPIGYSGAPQIRPRKYPFPWTDPQTPLPASSLTRPIYDAKRHLDPIRRFSAMHWTDRSTDRSSTGKFDDYRPLRYESDAA